MRAWVSLTSTVRARIGDVDGMYLPISSYGVTPATSEGP